MRASRPRAVTHQHDPDRAGFVELHEELCEAGQHAAQPRKIFEDRRQAEGVFPPVVFPQCGEARRYELSQPWALEWMAKLQPQPLRSQSASSFRSPGARSHTAGRLVHDDGEQRKSPVLREGGRRTPRTRRRPGGSVRRPVSIRCQSCTTQQVTNSTSSISATGAGRLLPDDRRRDEKAAVTTAALSGCGEARASHGKRRRCTATTLRKTRRQDELDRRQRSDRRRSRHTRRRSGGETPSG